MAAILEYRLNIDGGPVSYVFNGSGNINLFGTAKIQAKTVSGELVIDYDLRDYVYDLNHRIGQVILITGSPENLIYTVQFDDEIGEFTKFQLRSFGRGAVYFNAKWENLIDKYVNIIEGINERLGISENTTTV